jgi:hypothetical protein
MAISVKDASKVILSTLVLVVFAKKHENLSRNVETNIITRTSRKAGR